MKQRLRPPFEPDETQAFLVKVWAPLLLFFAATRMYNPPEKFAGLVLPGFLALLGLFFFTCVVIKPGQEWLLYRPFFWWKQLRYEEILDCKSSWIPGVGYLKLRRFVVPFGKLYFVLAVHSESLFDFSADKKLIRYIQQRVARTGGPTEEEIPLAEQVCGEESLRRRVGKCFLSVLLGGGCVFFFRAVLNLPGSFPPPATPEQTVLYRMFVHWWHLAAHLEQWPFNLLVGLAVVAGIVKLRFKRAAWGLAALLGTLLGSIAARIVNG